VPSKLQIEILTGVSQGTPQPRNFESSSDASLYTASYRGAATGAAATLTHWWPACPGTSCAPWTKKQTEQMDKCVFFSWPGIAPKVLPPCSALHCMSLSEKARNWKGEEWQDDEACGAKKPVLCTLDTGGNGNGYFGDGSSSPAAPPGVLCPLHPAPSCLCRRSPLLCKW
jgi:hypothetical protein